MSSPTRGRPARATDGRRFAAGREAQVDVVVVACPDGPLLVRGPALLVRADGTPVERRRATVALCRCGASAIKPFCDGSHKAVGFTTADEGAG